MSRPTAIILSLAAASCRSGSVDGDGVPVARHRVSISFEVSVTHEASITEGKADKDGGTEAANAP